MKKTTNPFDAIAESLAVILDADYEDTDVTDEELALAKKRFAHALRFVVVSTVEEQKDMLADYVSRETKEEECVASKTVSD